MRRMGKKYSRSRTFRYKRRRQRVGLALFSSLIIGVLAGLLFFGIEPYSEAAQREPVQRTATPTVDSGPEAIDTRRAAEAREAAAAPEVVAVPDIPYNATEEEAREMLQGSGLELGEIKREANEEYDRGGVFYQDPLPEVEVEKGSEVGITLSSGPEEKPADESEVSAPSDPTMYLTVPKLGLVDNTVYNDASPATLDLGAAKIPETGFPWQDNANPYIAGHRIGYEGTESYNQFYNLPSMTEGDEVILEDANGSVYTYEVTNIFAVMPQDTWVTDPVAGKDMVTLQTCVASVNDWWTITPGLLTSPPGPETARLIVQAERVEVTPA